MKRLDTSDQATARNLFDGWRAARGAYRKRRGLTINSATLAGLLLLGVGAAPGCATISGGSSPGGMGRSAAAWSEVRETQVEMARASAEKARREGRIEEAARAYEQVRMLAPETRRIDHTLAVLYATLGEEAAALNGFERAIAENSQDANLMNDIGAFHAEAERWSEAETWYRKALAIEPSEKRTITNLGLAVGMQGRVDEAVQLMTPHLGAAAAQSNAAMALARIGRFDEARASAQLALRIDRDLAPPRRLLDHLDKLEHAVENKNIDVAGLDR
ncbi:MAG TPA: tetratricopeptide repeat protein [Pirellulaceae bacterium]|nr:tetratricopeptide repeat protein [Pirellulaceae bacterium]